VLDRHGLVRRMSKRRHRATRNAALTGPGTHDLWCADDKGEFRPQGCHRCQGTVADRGGGSKPIASAMAKVHLSKEHISDLFKTVLAIPFEAGKGDVSLVTSISLATLNRAHGQTCNEGTAPGSASAALKLYSITTGALAGACRRPKPGN
jgi:hypothetical protein